MVDRNAAPASAEVFTFTDPALRLSSREALLTVLRSALDDLPDVPQQRRRAEPSAAHTSRWAALAGDLRELPTQAV